MLSAMVGVELLPASAIRLRRWLTTPNSSNWPLASRRAYDALAKLVKQINGGNEKKPKTLTHRDGLASLTVPMGWSKEQIEKWARARPGRDHAR